jgi:replicative DNA helicase
MAKPNLKLPPQNIDAEQSVLGCLLIDKNAINKVADLINSKDFYTPANEKIYEAIVELYEKSKPIDILTVTNHLKEKGVLKDIGGPSYLADLTNHVTTASHADHYARIVKEKKVLRDLIKASAEITEDAFGSGTDIEDLLDNVEQKILAISQKSLPQNFTHIRDELKVAFERIEKLHQGEGAMRGVATGFTDLDNLLSGLQKADLVIVGARPSFGKTAFVLDIARHAALKIGASVGIFSIELYRPNLKYHYGNYAPDESVTIWNFK